MDSKDILKMSLDDIVFMGRNKSYGGYYLRQIYGNNIKRGAIVGAILFALFLAYPLIADKIRGFKLKDDLAMKEVVLTEPPPLDKTAPPPPPPPPVKPQIQFVPPKVKEDKEVPKEEIVIPPEIPKNVDIGTTTVKGDTNATVFKAPEAPPPPPPPPVEKEPEKEKPEQIFTIVEQQPEFPDGTAAMFKWLSQNIKYPAIARENGIEGTVYVGFVVNTDGSIVDVTVKRGIGGGCNDEATRVVNSMPRWKPGKQQGRAVRVAYTLPIKFKLE